MANLDRTYQCLKHRIRLFQKQKKTYNGKTDSTPTPDTSLRSLNVVFRPAFRLAMTMPFILEIRRLFSGTSCWYHESQRKLERGRDL